ncbi:MAG: hypothetical protein GTN89_15310, partial [Acidobacteria bacterium]|nr:hypothetical protein [Acidobacteriota bacterium]NIQ31696.1 hypothetical protein [Acidobacteriota bacterium]NIQ86964.1 hypothetical protein [Acidobacteriota bacterium]
LSPVHDLIPGESSQSRVGVRASVMTEALPAEPSPMIGLPEQEPDWNDVTENVGHLATAFAPEPETPESLEQVAELLCQAD